MPKVVLLYRTCSFLLLMGMCASLLSSCSTSPEAVAKEDAVSGVSYSAPKSYQPGDPISVPSQVRTEAYKRGKELLAEYDVQYNQTIRFPLKDFVFETHGAGAIASPEDAQSRYPQWPVPKKLGSYQFVDFTLYHDRTSVVFPDEVPPPKNTIEILNDREPLQYQLCYKKGPVQFRIDVMPLPKDGFEREELSELVRDFTPWPAHPGAYFYPEEEDGGALFRALWISPEMDGDYAFFIHRLQGPDCLETKNIPFTQTEAASICRAIRDDFPKTPPQ